MQLVLKTNLPLYVLCAGVRLAAYEQLDVAERELRSRSARLAEELAECAVREEQLIALLSSPPSNIAQGVP